MGLGKYPRYDPGPTPIKGYYSTYFWGPGPGKVICQVTITRKSYLKGTYTRNHTYRMVRFRCSHGYKWLLRGLVRGTKRVLGIRVTIKLYEFHRGRQRQVLSFYQSDLCITVNAPFPGPRLVTPLGHLALGAKSFGVQKHTVDILLLIQILYYLKDPKVWEVGVYSLLWVLQDVYHQP